MPFNKKKNQEAPAEENEELQQETPEEELPETEPQPEPAAPDPLQAAQAKAEEYLNMAQRVQADFDNYRKRTKATRAEAFEDGAREFIKQLLPVVDNLERAIAQESADEALMTEVAEYLGVASSTAHRLLAMLQYRGFVRQERRSKAYLPGTAPMRR